MEIQGKKYSSFEQLLSLEWIETNGIGGYASSTVSGANSRRYHGLLVASLQPPVDRHVLLAKLDEAIVFAPLNETDDDLNRIDLGTNQYPGVIHPSGCSHLIKFEREIFPTFYYRINDVILKKTIASVAGENTTLVLYDVVEAPDSFTLTLLPLASARDFHTLSVSNDNIGTQYLFEDGIFRTLNYQGGAELFIAVPGSRFTEKQGWYYNFEYIIEQERGLDYHEDLYSHGYFSITLKQGDTLGVIISTENPEGREAVKLFDEEKQRREALVRNFRLNENLLKLALSSDQFIVRRGDKRTILAGYHWFSDWGRDTMISMPGLCFATGRFSTARDILSQFSENVSEGMLPNRFPEGGEAPEYNTMDATLWFFHAVHQYLLATNDESFLKTVFPILRDIMDWHYKGTRYNIKVDPKDELLFGGQKGVQLTWMDAKVGDWVVTPRIGKPVEINALWYNALCSMEAMALQLGNDAEATEYRDKAAKVAKSFNSKFWNKEKGYLYDYIDGEYKNSDLRPNQLYAISLPYPLLPKAKAKKVFEVVSENLFTSKGLRSLAPSHKDYRHAYVGDLWTRDGSYHQGTVWSFLLGAYIDALMMVKGTNGKSEAVKTVNKFFEHLKEAGVGTVSEIFDADPPHTPRGCIAQAWGVAEVLRVVWKYDLLPNTSKNGETNSTD
jgi:predicted glycogen debranching enzyme